MVKHTLLLKYINEMIINDILLYSLFRVFSTYLQRDILGYPMERHIKKYIMRRDSLKERSNPFTQRSGNLKDIVKVRGMEDTMRTGLVNHINNVQMRSHRLKEQAQGLQGSAPGLIYMYIMDLVFFLFYIYSFLKFFI